MAVEKFTYAGDPSKSDRDATRHYAGDTDRDTAELDDREIDYALTQKPNPRLAAADLLDVLAARYARKSSYRVGEVSKSLSDIAGSLRKRAEELRSNAGSLALPFFGGLTHTGKQDLANRTDDVQPMMRRGQFDSPRTLQFDENAEDDPSVQ